MPSSFTNPPYLRPTKLEWLFPEGEDWIANITSKSSRKLANNLVEIMQTFNLEATVKQLTEEAEYLEWLAYYSKIMTEQGKDVLATPTWLQTKMDAGLEIFLMEFHQNGKYVGSSVFSRTSAGKYTAHYKASDRLDFSNLKNASLGTIIELYFIVKSREMGATAVSSGTSRNGFGYYNTLGYLAFKVRLGYRPVISEIATMDENFESEPEKPCIWFMTQDQSKLELLLSHQDQIDGETMGLIQHLNLPIHAR